jgi:short-subunit dehydrogenase
MSRPLALVTGASSGIGASFAKLLAADHDLVLTARRTDALDALAATLTSAQVTVLGADLARPDGARGLAAEVERRGLVVDVLINNAGFGLLGPVAENDPAGLDEMVQVNVAAVTTLCRAFVPGMVARKKGGILNVASTAAFQPGPSMAGYYASKAYVLSFSEALWFEVRGAGVHVTCLCPGPVDTGFGARSGNADSVLFKKGPMGVLDADTVAKIGLAGLARNKRVVVPGALNAFLAWSSPFTPRIIGLPATARMQEKA